MAAQTGKKGEVSWAGKRVFRITDWTAEFDTKMLDVTSWTTGTAQWRDMIPGLQGVSGQVSGFWDMLTAATTSQKLMQTAMLAGTTGTLKLFVNSSGGESYTIPAYLSRQSVTNSIDDTPKVVWNYVGTGAPSYTTTTA